MVISMFPVKNSLNNIEELNVKELLQVPQLSGECHVSVKIVANFVCLTIVNQQLKPMSNLSGSLAVDSSTFGPLQLARFPENSMEP